MPAGTVRYCANNRECKNITVHGETTPTRVRGNRTVCAYCMKHAGASFKTLKTAPAFGAPAPGPERRGRPRLALDTTAKYRRLQEQRRLAQTKLRLKKALLQELESEQHPDWDRRWQIICDGVERLKVESWGKAAKVKAPPPPPRSSRAAIESGQTENGWDWRLHDDVGGFYSLTIREIDPIEGTRSDEYLLSKLTEKAYKAALAQLAETGIYNLKVTHPFSSYTTRAREFRTKFTSGTLTTRDAENLSRSMTFGFLVALFLADNPITRTNMPAIRTMYRIIGDAAVPCSPGPLQKNIDDWLELLSKAPLIRSTRAGTRNGAKSLQTLKILQFRLSGVMRNAEKYRAHLAWIAGASDYMRSRLRSNTKSSLTAGHTAHSKGYRCLRQNEICEILKRGPTIHHTAYAILALTTGLRPEELKNLTPDHMDKESGNLFYRGGKLMSRKNAAVDPNYLANPNTSTVAKLILANKDFFDFSMKDQAIDWVTRAARDPGGMKANRTLHRIAAYTGSPIPTQRDFRTTCATMLAFCGVPREDITHRLGHVSGVTTEQFYIKAIPNDGGAFAEIPDGRERGHQYFNGPEVTLDADGKRTFRDSNAWDTFLLVQFLQQVLFQKKREYLASGMNEQAANDAVLRYYQYDLVPKIEAAIEHRSRAKEKRHSRLPQQSFNPFAGKVVATPDIDLPFPVQKTSGEGEA